MNIFVFFINSLSESLIFNEKCSNLLLLLYCKYTIKNITIDYLDTNTLKGTIYFSGDLSKLNLILLENDILLTYLGDYSDISFISQ